jgi:hypothetical protein
MAAHLDINSLRSKFDEIPGLVEMSPDSKIILIIDVYVVVFWFGKYL